MRTALEKRNHISRIMKVLEDPEDRPKLEAKYANESK